LAARYAHELFGFLFRFVGSSAAADDLVQETFLQVHLAAASFDSSRAFKPWLYTIAANKARDFLRSAGRRQEQSLDATGPDNQGPSIGHNLQADNVSAAEQASAEEQRAAVRALIAQMPEHLRLILMLGYYQQLPYAEISAILNIPVGTVKSRLHAAVNYFGRLWRKHMRTTPLPKP
jgi:RNA polymerase sigma-70 factor, ECF subfamily